MFFNYIFSGNQIKNILFLMFRHLSLSSIVLFIFTFKKIFIYYVFIYQFIYQRIYIYIYQLCMHIYENVKLFIQKDIFLFKFLNLNI